MIIDNENFQLISPGLLNQAGMVADVGVAIDGACTAWSDCVEDATGNRDKCRKGRA
jgi:hypothetical protein